MGFFLGDLTLIHQGLHIAVIQGAPDHLVAMKVINARITRMDPVAVPAGVDEVGGYGTVWFLLGGNGREFDDEMRLFDQLLEHGRAIVVIGGVALKELTRCEHDLVRGLSATTTAAHAIGHDGQDAAIDAWMVDERDLVLLVFAVTLVDAGRGCEAETFGHERWFWVFARYYGGS